MNHVTLMGRSTATPELKCSASGVSVVNFSLAVDRPAKKTEGESQGFRHESQGFRHESQGFRHEIQGFRHEIQGFRQEKTADFFSVVCFRDTAEFAARYLRRGARTAVTGVLRNRKWEDRNGVSHTVTEVFADRLELIDWPEENRRESAEPQDRDFPRRSTDPEEETLPF